MKKYGHIILMAMAVLMSTASCSSSDDSEQEVDMPETGTPIAFSAQQGDETAVNNGAQSRTMTRATSLHEAEVVTFKVWGYKNNGTAAEPFSSYQTVFPRYTVNWIDGSAATTTSNSSGWEYVAQEEDGDDEQTIKYWDWSAKAYRFFAVTAGAGNPTSSDGVAGHKESFTMTADASDETAIKNTPYFSKLWFSTGSEALYPTRLFGNPVQLEFMKPFARVRFMFTYSYEPEGNKIKTKSFKPTDGSEIALKGSFTVSYPLTGNEIEESYAVTSVDAATKLEAFTEEYIIDGGPEKEIWYTVLPIDPSSPQGSYTMSVRMTNASSDKTAVVPAAYMQWRPGYSYTYIFKITEVGGVELELVQSAFTPWIEMDANHEVYNW